jgi:toxin-antitoxin system PIN domain toxin
VRAVDANVLIYAVNADSGHHAASRQWLDDALGGGDTVGFTWVVLLAFIRLSTKVGLFPQPRTPVDAVAQVREWLTAPGAQILQPGNDQTQSLGQMLGRVGTGGNLTNDAHLAAVAAAHRADVVSYDADFGRFDGIRWFRPDQLLS